MNATKTNLVALSATTILVAGGESLTLDAAKNLVGRTVEMPTTNANETAIYTVASVSQNRATGDIAAWMIREGHEGGRHAKLVEKR